MPMELAVLVDNNTLIDRYLLGEPGVSYHIRIDDLNLLFDCAYSGVFIKNATAMGIDLFNLDSLILSHAHLDHTWGLQHLIKTWGDALFEGRRVPRPDLVAHPHIFYPRYFTGLGQIGSILSENRAQDFFDLRLSSEPLFLHPDLVFLGEIKRSMPFEATNPIGTIRHPDGTSEDDFILDDSALVYKSPQGLVIITGCAHSGICNTIEYAMEVCGDDRIVDIIGGFHLLNASEDLLEDTLSFLEIRKPQAVHACHCTDLAARLVLSRTLPILEVGTGLRLNYQ